MRCPIRLACCAAALLAVLLPVPGDASKLDVRFRLGAHPFTVPSRNDPYRQFGGGSLTLRYQASGIAPLPGPVTLLHGDIDVEQTTLFSPNPTGMAPGGIEVGLHLVLDNAVGTLRPTGTLLLPDLRGHATGSFLCFPCPGYLRAPLNFPDVRFAWTAPLHLDGTQLVAAALAPRTIDLGTDDLGLGFPVRFGIQITDASEIDRQVVVPEPGSFATSGAGLLALAFFAARRRRRR
jgi:MYXO-CTERM domain-containing protein